METILKTGAEESTGKIKRNFKKGWLDQECEQVTVEKNGKYQSMLQRKFTRAAKEYYDARKKEKRTHKKKRRIIMKNNLNGYKNVILKMIVGSSTSK
jgi:hypothetical protein